MLNTDLLFLPVILGLENYFFSGELPSDLTTVVVASVALLVALLIGLLVRLLVRLLVVLLVVLLIGLLVVLLVVDTIVYHCVFTPFLIVWQPQCYYGCERDGLCIKSGCGRQKFLSEFCGYNQPAAGQNKQQKSVV